MAQDCCQLDLHSSTERYGKRFALNSPAVHWCLVTEHMYEEQRLSGVNGVAHVCCQLVLHSRTEQYCVHFALSKSAVHWCLVIAHLYKEQRSL